MYMSKARFVINGCLYVALIWLLYEIRVDIINPLHEENICEIWITLDLILRK